MLARLLPLLLSLAAFALWAVVSDVLNGRPAGDAGPYVVAAIAMAGGILVGLLTGSWVKWAALIVVAGFLILEFSQGNLSGGPRAGLLGYANAEAALAVQVGSLVLVAGATAARRWSWLWWLAAAAAMSVTFLVKSAAGLGLAGLVLLVGAYALLAPRPRARWAPQVGGAAIVAAGVVQVALTAGDVWPQQVGSALSARRLDLWADAWEILWTSPAIGRGPGSYAELSPAAADPDTTAAHSVLMQVLAEMGFVGALILAAVALSGLVLVHGAANRSMLVGAAAWVGLWVHGLVDYVMQFEPVLIAGGLALGAAAAIHRSAPDDPAV